MVDYFEVAKYPLSDLKNFLMGFIMGALSLLIIPLLFVSGYMVETIRETLNHSNTLPQWFQLKNWKVFAKHGFFVFLICSIYLLPAFLLSISSTAFISIDTRAVLQSERPWEDDMLLGAGSGIEAVGISLLFFGSLLFFAGLFLLPMALLLYSASGDIKYAFRLNELLPRLKRIIIPYLKAYVVSIFVFFLALLLVFIPWFAFLIGGILYYPTIFSARLFAVVFEEYGY